MVRPDRLERPTFWFVARRSIQLSYGRNLERKPYKTRLPQARKRSHENQGAVAVHVPLSTAWSPAVVLYAPSIVLPFQVASVADCNRAPCASNS
jgi:hypothetical protein